MPPAGLPYWMIWPRARDEVKASIAPRKLATKVSGEVAKPFDATLANVRNLASKKFSRSARARSGTQKTAVMFALGSKKSWDWKFASSQGTKRPLTRF